MNKQRSRGETDRRRYACARSRKPAEGGGPAGLSIPRRRRGSHDLHLQIMMFSNPGDSWSSKTETYWLRPTDLSCRSRTSEKWREKEDKIEEGNKRTKKVDDEWNGAEWQPSSWSCQQPMTWTSSSSAPWCGARTKRASVLIGNHQPIGTTQIKRVSGIPGSRRSNGSEE